MEIIELVQLLMGMTSKVDLLKNKVAMLEDEVDRLRLRKLERMPDDFNALQSDVLQYFSLIGSGLDSNDIPLNRIVAIKAYCKDADRDFFDTIVSSTNRFLDILGYDIVRELPAVKGSWWQKWFVRSREELTKEENQERLQKAERALELKYLSKEQSEVDMRQAEAASILLKSLPDKSTAAIQVGSLLIVKNWDNRKDSILVKTLSNRDLIFLERNQHLLKQPQTMLEALAGNNSQEQLELKETQQDD